MGKEGGLGEGRERGFKEIWKGEGGGDKGGRYYVCLNHHKGSVYHPLDYRFVVLVVIVILVVLCCCS